MNKNKILIVTLLTLLCIGFALNGVSASKKVTIKKYSVKLSDNEIYRLKNVEDEYIIKSTGKKLRDKAGYDPIYKTKKVKKRKYVYKYKLASRVTPYESWSYRSAYKTPKGYVFVGTKTVDCGDYEYKSYIKYRSKTKKTYYKKVKVKVGKKRSYITGTVKMGFEKYNNNNKFRVYLFNDYPGNARYRDITTKIITL